MNNFFSRLGRKVLNRPGPQVLPAVTTKNPYDQPLINPGPGDGHFSRPQVLGLGRVTERPYSSRPFGVAQDGQLF